MESAEWLAIIMPASMIFVPFYFVISARRSGDWFCIV
jgi:hypothetical protein